MKFQTPFIKRIAYPLLIGSFLYAAQGNNINKKNNIYTGTVKITKKIIYYDKLTINNARIIYPYFWAPVSFKINNLIVNGEGKNRFYGWRLVGINSLDGNASKILVDSGGGAVYINNIKNNNLKEIIIGKYTPLVYLGFIQKEPKKTFIKILTKKDSDKKIIIENKGKSILNVQCSGEGRGDIFYKGNPKQISVKGKCSIALSTSNFKPLKISKTYQKKNVQDLKQKINKDAWIPSKNIMYFIKYDKNKNGTVIGIIFGVNLKTNKIIKKVPAEISKATKYIKKIRDKGNVYYIYDGVPSSTEAIINHIKYNIVKIKAE